MVKKKSKSSGEELPYLPNNLAQKARISHLRPSLAFPQKILSLSVCQGLQLVCGQIAKFLTFDSSPFPLLWLFCEASQLPSFQ